MSVLCTLNRHTDRRIISTPDARQPLELCTVLQHVTMHAASGEHASTRALQAQRRPKSGVPSNEAPAWCALA